MYDCVLTFIFSECTFSLNYYSSYLRYCYCMFLIKIIPVFFKKSQKCCKMLLIITSAIAYSVYIEDFKKCISNISTCSP